MKLNESQERYDLSPKRAVLSLVSIALCHILHFASVQAHNSDIMSQNISSMEVIQGLRDEETPFGVQLSGLYKRSFGYLTIRDRLPVILTRVVDTLSRDKDEIIQKYGQESAEELKQIIGKISKLKNEMVTNKPLVQLPVLPSGSEQNADDTEVWNKFLEERTEIEGGPPTWYNTVWLYCECYLYRSLAQTFALTKTLQKLDPFLKQKQEGYKGSSDSIIALGRYTVDLLNRTENVSSAERKHEFTKLVKLNLWGNRCDLSLSGGAESNQSGNPIQLLEVLEKDILVDNTKFVWDVLNKVNKSSTPVTVDIVLDNAGYELFTDLCLASFLVAHGLAHKIRFYVKRLPWYVSDVTVNDFHWTIQQLNDSSDPHLADLGKICSDHLKNNIWTIEEESFWTKPFDFSQMKSKDPVLYAKLSEARLIVFKGDLNYRKLVGDINWEFTTDFQKALRGFMPTNLVSLRTVKADVCVGLADGMASKLREKDENWMTTGQYGLIQATVNETCECSRDVNSL